MKGKFNLKQHARQRVAEGGWPAEAEPEILAALKRGFAAGSRGMPTPVANGMRLDYLDVSRARQYIGEGYRIGQQVATNVRARTIAKMDNTQALAYLGRRRNSGAQPWASNEEYEAWKTRQRREDLAAAPTATGRLSVLNGGGPHDRAELSIGWGGVGAAGQALRFGVARWRLSSLPERFYYAAPTMEGQEAIATYILENHVAPTAGTGLLQGERTGRRNPGKRAVARKKRANPASAHYANEAAYDRAMAQAAVAYVLRAHAAATGVAKTAIASYAKTARYLFSHKPKDYAKRAVSILHAVQEIVHVYRVSPPELRMPAWPSNLHVVDGRLMWQAQPAPASQAKHNPAKPKGAPVPGHPGWRGFTEVSPGRFVEYRRASSPRKGCMVRTDRVEGARKLHFVASRYGEKAGHGNDGFLSLGHFDSREAAFAACERSEGGRPVRERGMGGHLMTVWRTNPLGADAHGFTQGFLQGHAEWGTPTPDEIRRAPDSYAVGYRKGRHAAGTYQPADAATAGRYYRGESGAHINPSRYPGWEKLPASSSQPGPWRSWWQHGKSNGFVAKKGRHWYGFSASGAPAVTATDGQAFQSIGAAMRAVAAGYFRRGPEVS